MKLSSISLDTNIVVSSLDMNIWRLELEGQQLTEDLVLVFM